MSSNGSHPDIERVLFPSDAIEARVNELAECIAARYAAHTPLTLLPVLSGSFVFAADLIRRLPNKLKIALIQTSAYPGRSITAVAPRVVHELAGEITDRHVLIVDDILDSGQTMSLVRNLVEAERPASVQSAVLLAKRGKASQQLRPDYVGFEIDDLFVVGYGLDYDDHYRNLPFIGVLKPELMR